MSCFNKGMLMLAVITGAFINASYAAAEELQEFRLDPMLVTAERFEKKDLDTAASVEVLTSEQLEKTGGTNLQEALKFATGVIVSGSGTKGTPKGTMTSKVVIRGVEKGTLVLVDGMPINQNGRYDLGNITTDMVERVEIVRGGGSVLYGSEATGGVINIITKKKRNTMIKTSWGNYEQQKHGISFQAGPVGISYNYEKSGNMNDISDPAGGIPKGNSYTILRSELNSLNIRYDINDRLYLSHSYGERNAHYQYKYVPQNKIISKDNTYAYKTYLTQLHYQDENIKASLSYNKKDQTAYTKSTKNLGTSKAPNYANYLDSREDLGNDEKTLGIDIQKNWKLGKDRAILGVSFQNDKCESNQQTYSISKGKYTTDVNRDYERNMYSVYGQYDHAFGEAANLIVSARETITSGTKSGTTKGESYNKFTPEAQYIYKLNKETSIYAKAGLSFMMPTFSQMFGSVNKFVGNASLKPQQGRHFEIGAKKNINNQAWRLAIFNYYIKDSIDAKETGDLKPKYENEDVKNTGIEISCSTDMGKGWSNNWGLTVGHPKKQASTDGVKGDWTDYYGRVQVNAGLNYSYKKLDGALSFAYLGRRVRDTAGTPKMRPYLMSDFNISYKPDKKSRFYLNIDNIFNRQDITSTASSSFYTLGRNVMVGYEYSF